VIDFDQFAKMVFAEETALVSGGGALWVPPMELGLSHVRLDGLLRIQDHARITSLGSPWCEMRGCDETVIEIKMPGDRLSSAMLQRVLLRRQARNTQRVEDENDPWDGEEPLWVVAPHVPTVMRARRRLRRAAPGCYRVGPSAFKFLWIAANELPLRDDLVPFLIARSGQPLVTFLRWVMTRRSPETVLRMIQILRVPPMTREELLRYFPMTRDPEILAARRQIVKVTLDQYPELAQEVRDEARLEGERDGERKGRQEEARKSLRRVLSRRGLALSAADDARIEACDALDTLERWLDQAITAATAVEALR